MSSQRNNTNVGKIHSIHVKNFVTYDETTLYTGQYLNLILGPNGTGKSTIVAAIILGMGGSPKLLSRSSDIEDYIKNGKDKDSARIQINIYKNKKETVAFERIIRSNGESTWKVDEREVGKKEYLRRVSEFNIQVDNLCQFLPQDRVQDFAKMNPQEILISTQKSVCKEEMLGTFNQLKELRKIQLASKRSVSDDQQKLKEAQQKYETLKGAVEIMQQRKSLMKQIEQCKIKKQWLECNKLRDELEAVKKDLSEQEKFVQRDKMKFESVKVKGEEVMKLVGNLEELQKKKDEERRKSKWKLEQYHDKCKALQTDIKLSRVDLENKKKEEDEREINLERATGIFQAYVQDFKNQLSICGTEAEIKEKKQKFTNELEQNRTEKEKLSNKHRDINRNLDEEYQPHLQSLKRKINDLENIPTRRLNMIRDKYKNVYEAVLWLRQNRHIFQGHVYEPMLLELNVINAENAKYLENSVNVRDLIAFTCVCKSDVDLLTRKLRNEQNLHVNVIYSEESDECHYKAKEPISRYEKYGFSSYLIDLIEGPAPILNFLCQAYHLHEIMIGNETVDNHADDLPNNIRLFFGGNFKYSVMISKYSRQKSSLREEIRSRNLFCMSINMDELNHLKAQLIDITRKTDILKNQRTQIENRIAECDEKRREIIQQKKEFEGKLIQLHQFQDQVKLQKSKIEQIQNSVIDIEEEKRKHLILVKEKHTRFLQLQSEMIGFLNSNSINRRQYELYRVQINQLRKQNSELVREITETRNAWMQSQQTYETINAKLKKCEHIYREKVKAAKELCNGKSPQDKDFPYERFYKRIPDNIEEIDDKIDELQSRVDCMCSDNQNVLREYEETKETIQKLTELIESATIDDNETEKRIKELHDKWYPKLCEVINNINEYFTKFMSSMKYAGEVQLLHNHERDYDEYGIKIMVQYRNSAKLQALDRFIQSGGERAVAIAVYTLSLQHLTNVPFRCVDEINQGMDAINERKIFNMIVQETAREGNSQYFFITPKLTSGFTYNKKVTVHLVFNGPFVTESQVFGKKGE